MTDKLFGIWCRVSGGITGSREAWMKRDGQLAVFTSREAAEAEAAELNKRMKSQYARASFNYRASEFSQSENDAALRDRPEPA